MSTIQKQSATQSQKLMVFVLTMALYGLASLFTELIPKFQVGIVEFSVEYFLFIPLTLAMLFDPISAALGAATGELVFSEIMLGQFGGLGEVFFRSCSSINKKNPVHSFPFQHLTLPVLFLSMYSC